MRTTPPPRATCGPRPAPVMCRRCRRLVLDDGVDVACASREGYTAACRSEARLRRVASSPRLRAGRACGRDEPRRLRRASPRRYRHAAEALAVLIEELGASSDLREPVRRRSRARRGALRQRAGAQKFLAGRPKPRE